MPDTLGLSPQQLARAFRAAFPNYRKEIQTDEELYQHLAETQPEGIRKLVGVGGKGSPPGGAQLPNPGDWQKAYGGTTTQPATPLPTIKPKGNALTTAASTVTRIAPPLAVAAGTALGALPTFGGSVAAGAVAAGGAAAAGESLAQEGERYLGLRDEIDPTLIGTAGVFGAVPGLPLPPALGPVARAGVRAAEGAGLGLAQQETESRLTGSPPPSLTERATVGAFGAALGGGFGAFEGRQIAKTFEAAAEQVRQRTMTREGLAQTITRLASDAKTEGLDELASRRYARTAAKALYQGAELPPMPAVDPQTKIPVEHGPYPEKIEAVGDQVGSVLAKPPASERPRLVDPNAKPFTTPARPILEPPPAADRARAAELEGAGIEGAVKRLSQFTAEDAGAVPAPRAGDIQPSARETTKFSSTAKSAAKQQAKSLAPAMEAPLGKPSAATASGFERRGAQGVKKAVSAADRFTQLDEPGMPAPPPRVDPHAADQGAAAVEALQRTGNFEQAQRAARNVLPPPPQAPEAPAMPKDVVMVGENGDPIGTVQVPASYDQPVISEAEYNSLYAQADTPHPLDPRGETGAVKVPLKPPIDFTVPPGDGPALTNWMLDNRQHVGEGFYKRAQAALKANNPTRAWQVIQAESLRTGAPAARNKALAFAGLRGEVGRVRQQEAGQRRTDVFPQPANVKPRQRGQLTMRLSGLKDVHEIVPTTPYHLPPSVQGKVLRAINRAKLGRIKANTDTDYRLFRQIAHQVLEGDAKIRSLSRALGITPEELAHGWTLQITEGARMLQRLSVLSREIPNVVEDVAAKSGQAAPRGVKAAMNALEAADDADEGLQQLYGGLFGLDPSAALAWARDAAAAMNEVHASRLLESQTAKTKLAAFNDLRRAGLTGTISAGFRNLSVGGIRWNAGIMSDGIAGGLASLAGNKVRSNELLGRARDRITAAPHLWHMLAKPWASSIFEMWPDLSKVVLAGRDPRKTLKAISSFSDAEAHFLGLQQQDLPQSSGQKKYITLIQSANRAQEYPLRALSADLRMRQLIRRRGFDPNVALSGSTPIAGGAPGQQLMSAPGADLAKIFGSPEAAERAIQDAVSYGLDFTFASDTLTGTINKLAIDMINSHPMLSALQAFPRYAWSAAPRFVWDHSPGPLIDMAWQVATRGKAGRLGQRFMRGQQTRIASEMLGRHETRLNEISLARGTALQERMALTKTRAIQRRRIDTLERYESKGTITPEQRQSLSVLQREINETNGALNGQLGYLGRLQHEQQTIKAQNKKLAKGYAESAAAAAPEDVYEAVSKATVGLMFWAGSHAIRSSENQQDLPWYKIRVPAMGGVTDEHIVDMRAFGPLTFYLFMGDLTASIGRDTDNAQFKQLRQEKIAAGENATTASAAALKESYHGKYTEGRALQEAAQLVFGLSPAGGVTALIYDSLMPDGLSVSNLIEGVFSIAGEWMASPFHPFSDASNLLSPVFPGEAVIRDPDMLAPEMPWGTSALTAPATKFPFVKQLFPEQYSQTTGEVVASQSPITRTLGGITLAKPPTPVESILQEAGVPGNKYHLPRLDDVGMTQQLAKVNAESLQEMYNDFVKDNPDWLALKSPEERRTYLEMPGGPLAYARAITWAKMQDYGEETIAKLRESPARAAAAKRQLRMLERWSEGTMPDVAEEPEEAPAATPTGLPRPPGFER